MNGTTMPTKSQLEDISLPIWQRLELLEHCPVEFPYKVGDEVTFTNDYDLKFKVMICGFSSGELFNDYGWCVHFCGLEAKINGYAWWKAEHPSKFSNIESTQG